jgi:hypothetical protein
MDGLNAVVSGRRLVARLVALLRPVSGQVQEHVVEAGPLQPEVVDLDLVVLEQLGDPGHVGEVVGRRDQPALCLLDVHLGDTAADQLGGGADLRGVGERQHDAGAPGLVLELGRRAGRDHPTAVDHDDLVGERVGLLEVLRGEQQRGAAADQLAQHLPELGPAPRVEPGGRLVEEQHRRRRDQAHRQVESTPHPSGVGLGDPVGGVAERELLEQLVGQRTDLPARDAVETADQPDVLPAGEELVDRGSLAGEAHAATNPVGVLDDVVTGNRAGATGRHAQGGEHPDGGRLARAVGPEHAQHGPPRDAEAHAIDSDRLPEVLDQILRLDGDLGSHG